MKKTRFPQDDQNSFNLTANSRQGNRDTDAIKNVSPSWQEHAYDRLKALYGTGKLLASLENIEATFPNILTLCAGSFPFVTAVLIRRKGAKVRTDVWYSALATSAQVEIAVDHAKEAFIYLTGASISDATDLRAAPTTSRRLDDIHTLAKADSTQAENFFALPLAVDHLPAFGVLQFEGSGPLNEDDLEFVSALTDLFAIGIDRVHKQQRESNRRDIEAEESSSKLSSSEAHITDLEDERELREKFVSLLTHDLRTPLTSIRLNAQIIQQRFAKRPETIPAVAKRIIQGVDRADGMITDLLDANRIRSGGKLPLQLEPFDLNTLVQETIWELAAVHGERFNLAPSGDVWGHWDRRGLRRIIENLCTNAVKYGIAGSPVALAIHVAGTHVTISVQNLGEPISPDDQKHLFQQFHRSRKAELGTKKGWGIGLSLVLGVAEAHGGSVKLESELQTGTIFTVYLPRDCRPHVVSEDENLSGPRSATNGPEERPRP